MKNLRNLSLIIIIMILASTSLVKGQDYKFRKYGIEEGICHPFVYTINQDKNGYLWFGTGEGLCRFDGLQFRSDFPLLDSIDAGFANVSYRDVNGNLWFGHNDGTVTFYNGRHFMLTNTTEYAGSTINGITGASGDTIFVAAQNEGILMITGKKHNVDLLKGLQPNTLIYSLAYAGNNQLLIGTQDGLHIYALSAENELQFRANIDDIPGTKIQAIVPDMQKGTYWIGTEDEGYYKITAQPSGDFTVTGPDEMYRLPYENVQTLKRDQDGNLWVGTFGNGAFKIDFNKQLKRFTGITHFNDKNGLGSLFIKSIFQDLEGNIWLGTYGKGAAAMVDQAFLFYNYTNTPLGNNILSVATNTDSSLIWLGSPNGILKTDQLVPDEQKFFGPDDGLPHDDITALYLEKSSRKLWIGTAESGLYTMDISNDRITRFFHSQNSLDNSINCISGSGGKIWVATNNGVFAFSPEKGTHEHWSTNEGLPHNKISQLYIDSKGIVWIATKSNSLYAVNADKRYKIDGNVELEFKAITADNAGNLWACTDGDGVFRFSDDTLNWFSTDNGLRSNYGYSMITDQNGDVWTGHRLAVSKIDAVTLKIKGFGTESGITGDCNNNAVALGANGRILFGTTDGLVIFNTRREEIQQQGPITNITALRINDKEITPEKNITLPYGRYKLRIDYIGLNYQDPKEVYYQYKMIGYDVDTTWSEPTKQTNVLYGRITDGNYTFKIRSCNQSGICNETPVTMQIRVKLPVWKTWWFISLSV
ncbi:MAG TPA: two-component regulator propeller domain-containing protein, partial [Bacteroidales bacterium]|nr:two-component regulator propeller domain-containing protein [Bacteroidales bacterium]